MLLTADKGRSFKKWVGQEASNSSPQKSMMLRIVTKAERRDKASGCTKDEEILD
jgi:hypothetical protein